MKTITATIPAFISDMSKTLADVIDSEPKRALSEIAYYEPHGDANIFPLGWIKIGMATITLTLDDHEQIVGNQIAMLKAAKQKVQADCEVALNQLDGQIQSLMCIEHKPEA